MEYITPDISDIFPGHATMETAPCSLLFVFIPTSMSRYIYNWKSKQGSESLTLPASCHSLYDPWKEAKALNADLG